MRAFATRGCAVLSADAIVHALYHRQAVRDRIVERFGEQLLGPDGEVDRVALATRVFADADDLAWLEALLHPLVEAEFEQWVRDVLTHEPLPPLIVYESPLLFEAGLAARFDRTLAITADDDVRRARIGARGGLERLAERETRMWEADRRVAAADDAIDNSAGADALQERVDAYIARYAGT
ncbi:MAG: dephospho-CoA kinase [Gaiellales bacterium]